MPIQSFSARDFRCLAEVEFEADPLRNLIVGPNGSGKTSILEAVGYLGRGKSFRGAPTTSLIRHGKDAFVLFGHVLDGERRSSVGVRNSAAGLEVRVDGETGGGSAVLAEALPLQIIDPDVHNLVAGAPDGRRRYIDWLAFHVEHGFLDSWRRFRRALKQRNAALRAAAGRPVIENWSAELCEYARALDEGRRAALAVATEALEEMATALLGGTTRFEYRSGWPEDRPLADVLASSVDRDLQQGSTQYGPHRADLRLIYDERQARKLVSRGQQKLLACAMVLAAAETAQAVLEKPLLLLLDDPAAELDGDSVARLMDRVAALGCQVIATSLEAETAIFDGSAAVFHVEHGRLSRAA